MALANRVRFVPSCNWRGCSDALTRSVIGLLLLLSIAFRSAGAQHAISVSDCIEVHWIVESEVSLSPDETQVAYLTRQADLKSNRNVDRLFVRDLTHLESTENGKLLLQSQELSNVKWVGNGQKIAVLSRENGTSQINFIDARSGRNTVVIGQAGEIGEYAVAAAGDAIVFSVPVTIQEETEQRPRLDAAVFVPFGVPYGNRLRDVVTPGFRLYFAKVNHNEVGKVTAVDVPTDEPQDHRILKGLGQLTMSPDGRYLTFARFVSELPKGWANDPLVKWRNFGGPVRGTFLFDLETGTSRLTFDAPAAGKPVWSDDSRTFAVFATSPVGSSWERDDLAGLNQESLLKWGPLQTLRDSRTQSFFHVFAVDAETGAVSLVLRRLFYETANLSLKWADGSAEIECLADAKTVVRLVRDGSEWREIERFVNPRFGNEPFANSSLRLGTSIAVGVNQAPGIPPDLYLHRLNESASARLTNLNGTFDHSEILGEVEIIEWSNKYGAKTNGYLIKPVGFQPGRTYPLVIMAKTWNDRFVCDGYGSGQTTAFPPQPLASSGFMVLLANDPDVDQEPLGYPGRMGEVYNWIEMIESAVQLLADRGLVDPKNVGIIGFSRTSWKTDFMLTHSNFRFAAASSADGGLYNYGTYWTHNIRAVGESFESQLGGPPYGASLSLWLKYAPAFNAEKMNSRLLMEYTSSGGAIPDPVDAYEFYTALKRNNKIVELYFYPLGKHQLDTPRERLSSLQRNVDWFRFWMQGYERPDLADAEEYVRWRNLRGE